jgi:predicted NBD/HSP70 family sugar kinase
MEIEGMPMKRNASNVNTLKSDNRALLVNEIRKHPLSRAQLSNITKLSKSAVTMIINELITEGQLVETEIEKAPKGRKPVLIDIVPDLYYAAGVELHRKQITVVITNLKSEIVDEVSADIDCFHDCEAAVDWICDGIRSLAERQGIPLSQLIGIGISSPGPLYYLSGVILNPPNFKMFVSTPITSMIQSVFNLPVILENNSVLLAMREYFSGIMKNYHNSLFVIISNGIGSCAIIDGQIFRGLAGFAGELGHTSIDVNGPVCSCGNKGCVELYATLSALKNKYGFDSYEAVVDDAYESDEHALAILEYEAECLATAFISAINLLDLDSIFLYGELNYRPKLLISKISSIIDKRSIIRKAHSVSIFPSSLDGNSSAATSTAAVLDQYFNQHL